MVTRSSTSVAPEVVVPSASRNSSRLDSSKAGRRVSGGKKKGAEAAGQNRRKVSGAKSRGVAASGGAGSGGQGTTAEVTVENAPRSDEKMNSEKVDAAEVDESETVAGDDSPERDAARSKSRAAVDVQQDSDSEADEDGDPPDTEDGGAANLEDPRRPQGYWGYSRPNSQMMGEEPAVQQAPAQPTPRSKSRMQSGGDPKNKNNLSYWRARRVLFYKNGDPYFPGVEFRFKPGRDVGSMEALLDKVSLRVDLPRGARYIFATTGERISNLEQMEDGGSYVVSSYKVFKVSQSYSQFLLL
ncbi:hypothetical protein B566_EDAN003668 [Ephemera danica]|nr:hypothetical protein B566_EDAN003668 [Ephemera danica]